MSYPRTHTAARDRTQNIVITKRERYHCATSPSKSIDTLYFRLFNEWISSVTRFLQKSQEMVTLVNFPPQEITTDGKKDSSPEEILFQELFSRFSEIFFLDPV